MKNVDKLIKGIKRQYSNDCRPYARLHYERLSIEELEELAFQKLPIDRYNELINKIK
jgi:hypothetical protein